MQKIAQEKALNGQSAIFISVYDGDIEKNFLRSGVLARVLAEGINVVLLVRAKANSPRAAYYMDNFSAPGVTVEIMEPAMTTAERYWYHLSWNSLPTRSSYVKRHDLYLRHKKHVRYALEQMAWYLGHTRTWRELLRFIYKLIPDTYGDSLFIKYKPVLLFAPNMFSAEDCRLIKTAQRHGVQTLTTMKSWDVPTTRGFTRVRADRILTFNEINKAETIAIGDYSAEKVHVIGFPQFDMYARPETFVSREEFFKKIGADPSRKLVLFAAPGDFKNPFTHEILSLLDDAISDGRITENIQILARFHPKYPSTAEQLSNLKNVIKDRPGTYFSKKVEKALDAPQEMTFEWTFTDADLIHLANSIKHSDITINTESTMTLDAAANDKPVVLVGFDGNQKLDFWQSVIRNYGREHLQAVLKTEGARLAHDGDELIASINTYLAAPETDAAGRARIRSELLFNVDGKAAIRVADHVIDMAKHAA